MALVQVVASLLCGVVAAGCLIKSVALPLVVAPLVVAFAQVGFKQRSAVGWLMLASKPLPVLGRLQVAGLGSLLRLCRVSALARRSLFRSAEYTFASSKASAQLRFRLAPQVSRKAPLPLRLIQLYHF